MQKKLLVCAHITNFAPSKDRKNRERLVFRINTLKV